MVPYKLEAPFLYLIVDAPEIIGLNKKEYSPSRSQCLVNVVEISLLYPQS